MSYNNRTMNYASNPNSLTSGPFGTHAASHNTGFFTDNTNPSSVNCNVLPAPASNVIAASGKWTGGRRRKSRKTKMRRSKKKTRKIKKCKKCQKCHKRPCTCRRKRKFGGTTNNVPNTPNFATGTQLPYGLSALANPTPYWKLDNNTNCSDNYSHFKGGRKRRRTRRRFGG